MHTDISIIIATRNRCRVLQTTLEQIARQDTGHLTIELIVVDNGSNDATPEVLRASATPFPLRALFEPRPGKNRALNKALSIASGRRLWVFTDDDVTPSGRWLLDLYDASQRWISHPIFFGPIVPKFPAPTPEWLRAHRFCGVAFARLKLEAEEGPVAGQLPFGPNFAVRAQAVGSLRFNERIGPSPLHRRAVPLGDETEFLQRVCRDHGLPVYVPTALVEHSIEPHQLGKRWLFERSFRYGRGLTCLEPDRSSPRLFGAPRYLWPMAVVSGCRYALNQMFGADEWFDSGLVFHQTLGRLYEYRRLHEDGRVVPHEAIDDSCRSAVR